MLVACPTCAKTYTLAVVDLGTAGRDVICSRCDATWFVVSDDVQAPLPALSPRENVDVPASAGFAKRQPRRRDAGAPALFCLGLAILLLSCATLGARHRIVALWPGVSAAYAAIGLPVDIRGLALGKVAAKVAAGGGLSVSGEIANIRQAPAALPMLRFGLRDESGTEVYTWSTPASKPKLKGGEKLAFEVHLDAPPKNMAAVEVRFADNQR